MTQAKVIAIHNHKGGAGKTTTAIALADALAREGLSILVIDLDSQSNLTETIGPDSQPFVTMRDVLLDKTNAGILLRAIVESTIPNVDLACSNIRLAKVESELQGNLFQPALILRNKIQAVRDSYDIILIDCPPSIMTLAANGLVAADYVLVPHSSGSKYSLDGMADLVEFIDSARAVNPHLRILGHLLTRHDERKKACQLFVRLLEKNYPDQVIFISRVGVSADIDSAAMNRQSVLEFKRSSKPATSYVELAREVMGMLNVESRSNVDRKDKSEVDEEEEALNGEEE